MFSSTSTMTEKRSTGSRDCMTTLMVKISLFQVSFNFCLCQNYVSDMHGVTSNLLSPVFEKPNQNDDKFNALDEEVDSSEYGSFNPNLRQRLINPDFNIRLDFHRKN